MRNLFIILFLMGIGNPLISQDRFEDNMSKQDYEYFLDFFTSSNTKVYKKALHHIETNWSESFEILAIETMYFLKSASNSLKILNILNRKTGKSYGYDFNLWYEYVWKKEAAYSPSYFRFKAALHHGIDSKFMHYFLNRENQSSIRLDEVRWGGVVQDGIPPLRNPKMILAQNAKYLKDDHIIFGISVDGDHRAYPKRILAWHELFTDTVGGVPVAGVYCTLCGTVILYKTEKNGVQYQLGTSGFLYRSNKLMYDQKTQSLWNTLWGKPVIGPLVGQGIQLEYLSVVTTTWGEWKKLHPETQVLSIKTGHRRNYGEGIAYQDYFATDDLMFNVQVRDRRLKNKQEILAIRLSGETDQTIAISSRFLRRNRIYQSVIANKKFTVFTDKSGAHRAYFTKDITFLSYNEKSSAIGSDGSTWKLFEDRLVKTGTKFVLKRLPTHNAFWFGFKAAFPNVQLVK